MKTNVDLKQLKMIVSKLNLELFLKYLFSGISKLKKYCFELNEKTAAFLFHQRAVALIGS